MKLIFMGTPALAVPSLEMLHAEHEILCVVTQPDKPAGRSKTPQPSAVKTWALEHGLAVAQPERARNEEFVEEMRALEPDAMAVVAYGQILPRSLLELAPRGCVNAHFSLLPRWRGAAPVQHALISGDRVTGVTTQWMAEKLDSGDVIVRRELEILPGETTADLWNRLTPFGAETLRDTMRLIEAGNAPREPQNEAEITWAPQLSREDGRLDWTQDARALENRVRGTNPWPGAWTTFRGATVKIWRARAEERPCCAAGELCTTDAVRIGCGQGSLVLEEIQPEGRPRMKPLDWARGARLEKGDRCE
ncbi:MAG TPA: methionyl-tRNA formyltransferase [Abditibacteriaceae bacterium]|jgi:methionyl-tRNA formyltransferase